jgi:hypothetical protein
MKYSRGIIKGTPPEFLGSKLLLALAWVKVRSEKLSKKYFS